jgi:hypothetical protein
LKALPKLRAHAAADEAQVSGGQAGGFAGRLGAEVRGRRSGRRRLLVYAVGLTAIVAAAFVVGALAAPAAPKPNCARGVECGSPPVVAHRAFAFPGYTAWQSSGFGYSLRYNDTDWSIANQDATNLELQAGDGFSVLVVRAVPESQTTPTALLDQQISLLQGQLLGFTRDSDPRDQLLGTNVGLIPGPGGVYTGTIASPQGPQAPVSAAIVAAGNGSISIAVTVIVPGNNAGDKAAVYQRADDIIDSIDWSTT